MGTKNVLGRLEKLERECMFFRQLITGEHVTRQEYPFDGKTAMVMMLVGRVMEQCDEYPIRVRRGILQVYHDSKWRNADHHNDFSLSSVLEGNYWRWRKDLELQEEE